MASAGFSTGSNGMDDAVGSSLLNAVIPFMSKAGAVIVGLAAIIGGFLYVKQDSLLYYPEIGGIPRRPSQNPRRYRSPDEHQVPFENHKIRCADGVRIHAWLMLRQQQPQSPASEQPKMPTIVFFHGNAGNIGLRLPNALQMLQYLDAHILLVEYRGYGDSDDAQINEAGLKLDAEAALKFVHGHPLVDPTQIFIFGRSLGGSVAFHLASYAERHNLPIAGVMVENTFLSIAAMVDSLMPYVAPFKALILRIGWNSGKLVPQISSPILYLAGSRDELVPHFHMIELYKTSKASRFLKMHIIEGGTHNESWMQGGTEYWAQVREFMQQAVLSRPANANAPISMSSTSLTSSGSGHAVEKSGQIDLDSGSHGASGRTSGSSIPIMPSRLVGMLSEAVTGTGSGGAGETPAKKEN